MSKKKDFKPDPKADELEGKVQVEGQEDAGKVNLDLKAPHGGQPEIKEVEEPKSVINTKNAAEVVTAGTDSSGIGGLRRGAIVFSGGAGRTQGDESATTKENAPYKSGDRTGRRADPITRKIDLIDAEIIKTKRYQSKPLCETDKGMGYNGNYFNEHAITQKNSGGAPADPLFERSIDDIELDMLYRPNGQFNIAKGTKDLKIRNWNTSLNNGAGGYDSNPVNISIGNWLTRKLTVTIDKNNHIKAFQFDKADLSVPFIDEETYRLAGDAYMRDKNQRELDRNVMISLAGNESDPKWSCLGDAIIDSSEQNRFLAMLDAMAGNYVGLSKRKLDTALAFQINKAAKDGSRITGPMAEMVNGCIPLKGYGADATVPENIGRARCFSKEAYVKGGAGLWLAINDSLPKYTSKGKLLSLPLSFKSASTIAQSNMDPLVADQLLFDLLKHNELFSTIDGPYDPLKPIVFTDKAGLVTPIPLDVCKSGVIFNPTTGELEDTVYTMHYENMRNKYNIRIRNFFISGIFRWINERADRIRTACDMQKSAEDLTIEIPVVSSTSSISLWDLIVCSATPYIVEERVVTLTEILKYEKNHGYPYTGKVHLKDVEIHACDNYSFEGVDAPLTAAIAKPVAAIKVLMPEVFWPISKRDGEEPVSGKNGIVAYTVLPHYFVQNQFVYDKEQDDDAGIRKLVLSDEGATMAYPTVRSGNMFSFFDTVYGMEEEDYKLALDRMVVYPGYQPSYPNINKIGGSAAVLGDDKVFDALTYKYGLTADGSPVIPYFAYAKDAADVDHTLTVLDVLATPRELGLFQVAPAGVLSPILSGDGNALNTVAVTSSFLGLSGPGFRARVYHGHDVCMENAILDDANMNITNNASFRADYVIVDSTPANSGVDYGFKFRANVSSNRLQPFVTGSYDIGSGDYDPETGIYNTKEAQASGFEAASFFKYLWTRMQRLPFVVNPFDCNGADLTEATNSWTGINTHDIYDMLYVFGFAGFRASDYKQLVYGRVKERIAKGMNYVVDPFVAKSMLLK